MSSVCLRPAVRAEPVNRGVGDVDPESGAAQDLVGEAGCGLQINALHGPTAQARQMDVRGGADRW